MTDSTSVAGKSFGRAPSALDVFLSAKARATKPYTNVYPLGTLISMKDVGLRIRVQRDLRDEFRAACRAQDIPAAQVIRTFMRQYVASHAQDQVEKKEQKKGAKSGNAEE